MKSEIKIDFIDRNGKGIEPVIRVEQISSDDPRDTLLATLFQSLQQGSFLQLEYRLVPNDDFPGDHNRILLFKPESNILNEGKKVEKYQVVIQDNSKFFRQFLDIEGIQFKPSGHQTIIYNPIVDVFELGQKYEQYKNSSKQPLHG